MFKSIYSSPFSFLIPLCIVFNFVSCDYFKKPDPVVSEIATVDTNVSEDSLSRFRDSEIKTKKVVDKTNSNESSQTGNTNATLKSSAGPDCSEFKTGVFKYAEKEYAGWTITRKDGLNIESGGKGDEITSTIKWISDCEYVLKYKSHKNIPVEQIAKNNIHVKILSKTDQGYFCEVTDSTMVFRQHLIRLK